MRSLTALVLASAAVPAAAQQTYLTEDFESGLVPPAGWIEFNNGNSNGWEPASGRMFGDHEAFHDDFRGANENNLMSPAMDLTGASTVWAHCVQHVSFASHRDHHYVAVSLDSGVTFVDLVDDLAGDGESGLSADLGAYAGMNGVHLAYRYLGDWDTEWRLDNIAVTDSSTPPPAPTPGILDTQVNPATGNVYHLLESSTWTAAEAVAVSMGGHLVTVDDQAENDWLKNTFGLFNGLQTDLWLGLNDVAAEGVHVWVDGSTSSYTNWAAGEPNNSTANDPNGEDYVYMYGAQGYRGKWNDNDDARVSWQARIHGVVELPAPPGPGITVSNLVAGQIFSIDGTNFTATGAAVVGYSLTGGGPTTTPFGVADLSPPIRRLPALVADPSGAIQFSAPVPPGLSGTPIWFQAYDVQAAAISNGLAEVVG